MALGLPLGLLADGALWYAVTLDRAFLPEQLSGWISGKGVLLGVLFMIFPWIWRLGIRIEERWGQDLRRCAAAPVAVLAGLCLLELLFRAYPIQDLFWQSVRARAGDAFFTREVSLFRLDVAAQRAAKVRQPGVVVVGSSQMLHALDVPELTRRIRQPVYRRAVAGMFPIEMCAWQDMIDAAPGSTLLMMLSGLDLGARASLMANAIRPMSTSGGMRDLVAAANVRLLGREWRSFVDLGAAAYSDLWRCRDYFRWIAQNPCAPHRDVRRVPMEDAAVQEQRRDYAWLGRDPEFVRYALDCLRLFLVRMAGRFDRIVVIEGQVNPLYEPEHWVELSEMMLALLEEFRRDGRIIYVPIEAQGREILPSMWGDMMHVNPEGRKVYAEIFAQALEAETQDNRQ